MGIDHRLRLVLRLFRSSGAEHFIRNFDDSGYLGSLQHFAWFLLGRGLGVIGRGLAGTHRVRHRVGERQLLTREHEARD